MKGIKYSVPALIGAVLFFTVFNLFYTTVPFPFQVASVNQIYNHTPIGYVHVGDQPDKIVAWSNSWRGYTVIEYWYHWKYDGFYHRDDWEPVILLLKGNNVTAVASRMHYMWRVLYVFPEKDGRPIVSFNYMWHTPLYMKMEGYVRVKIMPTIGNPPQKIDYKEVFGFGYLPTESAIASALIFSSIAGLTGFSVSRYIILRW